MKNKEAFNKWAEKNDMPTTSASKKQFETLEMVKKDLRASRDWEKTAAWQGSAGGSNGTDLHARRELQKKLWLGWYVPSSENNFKSNVKIPETTGRVESLFQRVTNTNLVFAGVPAREGIEVRTKAKMMASALDQIVYDADVSNEMGFPLKDTIVHSVGVFKWQYQTIKRDLSYAKTKDFTPEEKKKLEKGDVIWEKKEKQKVYEGFNLQPIPINEFFHSPKGWNVQGRNGLFDYAGWERRMTVDEFKGEYGDMPGAMNVDKVKKTSDDSTITGITSQPKDTFASSDTMSGNDYIDVVEIEYLRKDRLIVMAGEQIIIDQPLKYNHKNYSYHATFCIRKPYSFEGISLPDLLENIQSHEEALLNMMIDTVWQSLNQKYLVESGIWGEFSEQLADEDSRYIPVNTMDGRPLASKIAPILREYVNQDSFQLVNILGRFATMATQVDPSQLSLQKTNISATATQASAMVIEGVVNNILKNLSWTMTWVGKQSVSMVRQIWSTPMKLEKIAGKKTMAKHYRQIKLKDYKLDTIRGTLETRQDFGTENFVEFKPEYMGEEDEIDIRISPTSYRLKDETADRQAFSMEYAQMMPNAIDPTDPASAQMPGAHLYDARVLARMKQELNNMPEEVCLAAGFDSMDDLDVALEDIKKMSQGEYVVGVPGRTPSHNLYEKNVLDNLNSQLKNIEIQLEETKQEGLDEIGNPMPPVFDPGLSKAYEDILKVSSLISGHLQTDMMPRDQREAASLLVAEETAKFNEQQKAMSSMGGMPMEQPTNQPTGGQGGIPMPPSLPQGMNPQTGMMQNGGLNQSPMPQPPVMSGQNPNSIPIQQ